MANGKVEELSALNDDYEDDFGLDSARQQQLQAKSEEEMEQPHSVEKILDGSSVGVVAQQEDEDVIDIDNPEDLAAKGLKRIQIEGEEEEYLMDQEGNIYDLRGNFIGTTDDDGGNGGLGGDVASGTEQQ